MDPEQIPVRSSFWSKTGKTKVVYHGHIFDFTTTIISFVLALSSFILFWPVVSRINFEEAFYTPLAPFLLYVSGILGFGPNESMRALFVVSCMISTVGVYSLARELTRQQIIPLLASVIYLVPPIPVLVLTLLNRSTLETDIQNARNFLAVVYGDGAHFLALALLPFAAMFFIKFLKKGTVAHFAWASIFAALVFLANRSQAFNLILIFVAISISESLLDKSLKKIKRLIMVIIFCFGLACFWYTPSFIFNSAVLYGNQIVDNAGKLFPLPFILSALFMLFSLVFFARRQDRQTLFISLTLTSLFLALTLDWFTDSQTLVPHPNRLITNLNIFSSILIAILVGSIINKFHIIERLGANTWSRGAKILGAIALGFVSFAAFASIVLSLSTFAINWITDPGGPWSKVSSSFFAEKQYELELAKGNFNLINNVNIFQMQIGTAISIIFLMALLFLAFKKPKIIGEESEA